MTSTQATRLLKWLKDGKHINRIHAYDRLGIMNLNGRVSDLINDGHKVRRKKVRITNRFGEHTNITEFYM